MVVMMINAGRRSLSFERSIVGLMATPLSIYI